MWIVLAGRATFNRLPVNDLDTRKLAKACDRHRTTVEKGVAELEDRRIILTLRGQGKACNKYRLNPPEKWVRKRRIGPPVVVQNLGHYRGKI